MCDLGVLLSAVFKAEWCALLCARDVCMLTFVPRLLVCNLTCTKGRGERMYIGGCVKAFGCRGYFAVHSGGGEGGVGLMGCIL